MKISQDPTGMKGVYILFIAGIVLPVFILITTSGSSLGCISATLIFIGFIIKAAARYRQVIDYQKILDERQKRQIEEIETEEGLREHTRRQFREDKGNF